MTYAKVGEGHADGAVTDRCGQRWTARWGPGKIACLDDQGSAVDEVAVPALQPTRPTFTGPGRTFLAVPRANAGMNEAERAPYPLSGSLLIYKGNVSGWASPYYRYSWYLPSNLRR